MPRQVKSPLDELGELARRTTRRLSVLLLELAKTLADPSSSPEENRQRRRLERFFYQTMTIADLLGRRRLLLEADAVAARNPETDVIAFQERGGTINPLVPLVSFQDAIDDLVKREPRLAEPVQGEPMWQAVARLYRERHAFALARSTELSLTRKIQEAIGRSLREGIAKDVTIDAIERMGDWTRSYAETVYRTNLNTAFTAGRFEQAKNPNVRRSIGGFMFNAVGDRATRNNHQAAHGLIAHFDDEVWDRFSPPLGYNCRCSMILVDKFTLRRRGLLDDAGRVRRFTPAGFSDARPDEGFGGRARRAIYA